MKSLLSLALVFAFAAAAVADIQAPPMADQGRVRKFGRGISNVAFGVCELPFNMAAINDVDGNNALGYGVILGVHRSAVRITRGVFDIITAPGPAYKGSYRPPFPSNLVWGYNGYEEFAPELGFETRYEYARFYRGR
ncbi:MAG TPA: exosortase system-associated protein, TIGR04073 family [Chthoniobacteraceae bacterium]|nr:exosortase system-associated protein, TIGR04073 family [Chthoniobacteraceae bacterium]